MSQIMFDIGDVVRYQESRKGEIVNVGVNEDNDTIYTVDFNTTLGKFLAKDLTLVKEDEK